MGNMPVGGATRAADPDLEGTEWRTSVEGVSY